MLLLSLVLQQEEVELYVVIVTVTRVLQQQFEQVIEKHKTVLGDKILVVNSVDFVSLKGIDER